MEYSTATVANVDAERVVIAWFVADWRQFVRAKARLSPVIEYLTALFDVNDDVIFYLHFTSIAVNKLLL